MMIIIYIATIFQNFGVISLGLLFLERHLSSLGGLSRLDGFTLIAGVGLWQNQVPSPDRAETFSTSLDFKQEAVAP